MLFDLFTCCSVGLFVHCSESVVAVVTRRGVVFFDLACLLHRLEERVVPIELCFDVAVVQCSLASAPTLTPLIALILSYGKRPRKPRTLSFSGQAAVLPEILRI